MTFFLYLSISFSHVRDVPLVLFFAQSSEKKKWNNLWAVSFHESNRIAKTITAIVISAKIAH